MCLVDMLYVHVVECIFYCNYSKFFKMRLTGDQERQLMTMPLLKYLFSGSLVAAGPLVVAESSSDCSGADTRLLANFLLEFLGGWYVDG